MTIIQLYNLTFSNINLTFSYAEIYATLRYSKHPRILEPVN